MNKETEKINLRHLRGFRRFQNAALRALSVALATLKPVDIDGQDEKLKAPVKVGDMKTLVSTYKEAVSGERTILGLEEVGNTDSPGELLVRWVDEDEQDKMERP